MKAILSGVAGAIVVVLLAWAGWAGFRAVSSHPVEHLSFAGDVARLDAAELEAFAQAVRAAEAPSIEAIRASARKVPWVRDAAVRRTYPAGVQVTFVAHTAFARWNDGELVSRTGEVFAATGAGELPRLRGPEGTAAQVVREYLVAAEVLEPLGAPLTELRLSPRGSWHATLASGLVLSLGRGDWRARAERFVAAWPRLAPEARATTHADLRYSGGFAMKRVAAVAESPKLTLTPALSQGRGRTP